MYQKFKVGKKYYETESCPALFAVIEGREDDDVRVTVYNFLDGDKKVAETQARISNDWLRGCEVIAVNVYGTETTFTAQYPDGDYPDDAE